MKSLIIIILLFSLINVGAAEVFNVNEGESIQAAVDNATYGDVIYVHNGTYNENILITQSIALVGRNATIHGNSSTDNVIDVAGDGVHIVGFNITSVYNGGDSGIYLHGSDHSLIADNTISMGYNNYYAITSDTSYNVSIINNTLYDNTYGILLEYSNGNTISNNTITDNMYRGIRMQYNSFDNIIENNTILRNGKYGISLYYYLNNNTIIDNTINENGGNEGCGVWVSYFCDGTNIINNTIQYNTNKGIDIRDGSTNTNITGNDVSYNDGLGFGDSNTIHIDGLSAAPCDSVIIKDNIVCNNPNIGNAAIYIWECSNNQIVNNTVTGHDGPNGVVSLCVSDNNIISDNNVSFNTGLIYGGITLYSCDNNTVTRNMLINNTDSNIHILYNGNNTIYDNYIDGDVSMFIFDADVFNSWNVTSRPGPNIIGGPFIGGNYYTDYNIIDLNGDGFGGAPYIIPNKVGLDGHDWLPLTEVAGEPDPIMCGDANSDETVNIIDVIGIYRRIFNPDYPIDVDASDVNCDGSINIIDVIEVYRSIFNSDHVFNCC